MRAALFLGGPLLFASCVARAQGLCPHWEEFYKYGLRKTVELACESGYNEFISWGVMPCLGAWCGARMKRGRGMEDWMKQPADIRRPKQRQGERRGMAEVPLGSVEIPVSQPAPVPQRKSRQGAGAPGTRAQGRKGRPAARQRACAPRPAAAEKRKKKASFAGFWPPILPLFFFLAGVITLFIEQPWKTAGLPAPGSAASGSGSGNGAQSAAQGPTGRHIRNPACGHRPGAAGPGCPARHQCLYAGPCRKRPRGHELF